MGVPGWSSSLEVNPGFKNSSQNLVVRGQLKPIFHWKLGSRWEPNANKIDTNNMKSTWTTPAPRVGDPKPPIFHLLVLGVGVGGNAHFSVFGYQRVGIPNAKLWHWGSKPMVLRQWLCVAVQYICLSLRFIDYRYFLILLYWKCILMAKLMPFGLPLSPL